MRASTPTTPRWAVAVAGLTLVLATTGCSASGFGTDAPIPTQHPSSTSSLSAEDRQAIADAQAQADAANSPTAPPTILPDTIETWPALDSGARQYAAGSATEESAGVYRYVTTADDALYAIATRFGLCTIDVEESPEAEAADGGKAFPQPDQVITLQRHRGNPDEHAGAVCNHQY